MFKHIGFLQRGFTLIEIIIVISIIGTLATALYPSVNNYIERGRRVDERELAKEFIKMFQDYIKDNGGITQYGPWGWQCITATYIQPNSTDDSAECPSSFSYHNPSLNTYFQSSSQGKLLLQKRDEFCRNQLPLFDCATSFASLGNYSPASWASWGGNWIFQGEDPTDTRKLWRVNWYVPLGSDNYDTTGWNHGEWTSHGDQTSVANARCIPGIAQTITQYSNPLWQDYNYVECMYRLE